MDKSNLPVDEMSKPIDNDPEAQYAARLHQVLKAMRADLSRAAVKRVLKWTCERNGVDIAVLTIQEREKPARRQPQAATTETVRLDKENPPGA